MYNRVLFIGSKNSGLNVLKTIYGLLPELLVGCVTVDDLKDGRSSLDDFISFCKDNRILLDIVNGGCQLDDSITKFVPDICIVMGWYHIIPNNLINRVPGGFIGIHNSLLPSHRGFAPVVWSIIAGEEKTGFSVFSFDEGMDTGKIWYQEAVIIEESDYIADVLRKIDERVQCFFEENYKKIIMKEIQPYSQNEIGISYGARRIREDGRIQWDMSAREIYNFIRAQSNPYPGAFSYYNNKRLTIWKSDIFPYTIQGAPGQIGLIGNNYIVVVCGRASGIIIHEVDIEGELFQATEIIKGLSNRMY